jgi:hypothetical protein
MGCLQVPPPHLRAPGASLRFTVLEVPSIRLVSLMKRYAPRDSTNVPRPTTSRNVYVHCERQRDTLARMTSDIEAFLKQLRSHPEILSAATSNLKL